MTNTMSLFCATAIAAMAVSAAHAQVEQKSKADDARSEDNSAQLQEVIVTAQKRFENSQVVPVAVSTVNAETLEAAGIKSVLDVHIAVPSLNSFNTNGYLTNSIRGVGSVGNGPGVEYPVAVYVDGVYIAAPLASTLLLNNIASVDVLKGPQGTLFGRNATGGLIQVTTRTPDSTTSGKFELGYANFGTLSGSAYLSGGIASNVYADISFEGNTQSRGWGTNFATGNDTYRVQGDLSTRSKWIWEANPDTKFTLIGDYARTTNSLGTLSTIPGSLEGIPPYQIAPDLGYNANNGQDGREHTKAGGVSLRYDQGLGSVRLSSITAYRRSRFEIANTLYFAPENLQHYWFIQQDKQFSQEIQLGSENNAAKLKWTTGLYYFDASSGYGPEVFAADDLGIALTTYAKQKTDSLAGYGQASYEILDATNVTVGARYTYERRQLVDTSTNLLITAVNANIFNTYPDKAIDYRKVTFRLGLDHRFTDQVFGYVSFNRGFKSGGFNLLTLDAPAYDPEELDAYEAGIKSDLLDKRVRVNVAGFYYDYSGLQIQRIANNGSFNVVNGASARIYGAETDITAILSSNFSVTGGVSWLDPNFRAFPGCPVGVPGGGVPTTAGDCGGNQLPIAAKLVTTLGLHYSTEVGADKLSADVNGYYNSGFYAEPDNVIRQDRFVLLGASLKWQWEHGYWIRAFGNNLTNRRIITYAATQGTGNQVAEYAAPRTYGVAIGYEF